MPRINDGLNQHTTGSYGYSAVGLEVLGATEYTLVSILQDTSGSVAAFKENMEKCIQQIVQACQLSPRADNLLVRLVEFSDGVAEIHGFKLLSQCNLKDYNNCLTIKGMTALYDAAENAIAATEDYGKQLSGSDFAVNGIVFFITDGCNNCAPLTPAGVKKLLAKIVKDEFLESLVTVLIGVGTLDPNVSAELSKFKNDAGLTQFVEIQDASPKSLAKLAAFVSKSISSQSQSIGSGASSKQLDLEI